MSDVVGIEKQISSIVKGSDKKNDALMLMSPEYNWSQLLTAAPYSIALLGQLILISTDTDFTLEDKPPKDGFKLIRYPNSFRASLVQVSNEGWTSFNLAHTNMDQIRLYCGNVDSHIKRAVKFLLHGTPVEVERILPMSLNKIQKVADECLSHAQEVENSFVQMMQLIGELLEASTNTKGVYESKQQQTEIALKIASTEKDRVTASLKEANERLKQMDKEVEKAQSEFKEAMDSIPSDGELFGLQLGDIFVGAIRSTLSVGKNYVESKISSGFSPGIAGFDFFSSGKSGSSSAKSTTLEDELSTREVYIQARSIYKSICSLVDLTTAKAKDESKPGPDWRRISKGDAAFIKQSIQRALTKVGKASCSEQLRIRVSNICNDGIAICSDLLKFSRNLTPTEQSVIEKTVRRVDALQKEARILDTEAQKNIGANPLGRKSPFLSKMQPQGTDDSLAQNAMGNARYKTTLAKETLKDAKRRQEKSADQVRENNERLTQFLVDMSKLQIEKVDFDTIRDTLVKGITALAELREQWGKLVRFFQMLANIIKCCLSTSLTAFVDEAKIGRELKIEYKTYQLTNIFRDVIFEHASKCSQISYIVYTIASTYVDISNKHIMPKITGLGRLIALDPAKDKQRINREREKLYSGCQEAQSVIRHIAAERKKEFNDEVDKRLAQISQLEAKLPAIEAKKEKDIKDAVAKVFQTGDTEMVDQDSDESPIEDEDDLI